MTSKSSPITPPPELVQQWFKQAHESADPYNQLSYYDFIATAAAQWGADQELEVSCAWLAKYRNPFLAADLKYVRRPKPPSLKEQALEELEFLSDIASGLGCDGSAIRRALEALPND
jgi:hypothetical protein